MAVKSFESNTEETDFSSVSAIISILSTSSDNGLTVLPNTPNISDTINLEELKNEQKNDSEIKPIYHPVVSNRKLLNSERTKFGKKNQK